MPQIQDQHFMQEAFNTAIIDEELRHKLKDCPAYVLPNNVNGRAAAALIKEDNVIVYRKMGEDVVTLFVRKPIPQEFFATLGVVPV